MKIFRSLALYLVCLSIHHQLIPAAAQTAKNSQVATLAPYSKEIQELLSGKPGQAAILKGWQTLYNVCKSQNSGSTNVNLSQVDIQNLEPIFTTNYFDLFQQKLADKNLFNDSSDPLSAIHKNYASVHLLQAIKRLNSTRKFIYQNGQVQLVSNGDVRDMGIIVDVYNNTKAQFAVYQRSLDGKQSAQIGVINPGTNDLNFHLAALQDMHSQASKTSDKSLYYLQLVEVGSENPVTISLKFMQGNDFIQFLKTLPRSQKDVQRDTFEMNGLPTSSDFMVKDNQWYLVLAQNPTPAGKTQRDPNQRIQLINASQFAAPYLLNMQINAQEFDISTDNNSQKTEKINIFQPSIRSVHFMANAVNPALNTPILLLPKFLWDMPQIKTIWTMFSTIILASETQYKLFGLDSFGDAFEYFKNLNCFGNQYHQQFFIDLYNCALFGTSPYNASWLMSNVIYETDLQYCSDLIQVYTAQDPYGHIVVNEHQFYYINFLIEFIPKVDPVNQKELFLKQGFNALYAYPLNQLYSMVINALTSEIKEGVFGELTQLEKGTFQLILKNKKNKIINTQKIYLYNDPANVAITFTNIYTNWIGSSLPADLLPLEIGQTQEFKVTYEFSSLNNKHILLVQHASPIDKQEVFLPLQFTEYPCQELYLDVYHTFNVKPVSRCYIIKDGILPECLMSLGQRDWKTGIYMVPLIENNGKNNKEKPVSLVAMFYDASKAYIGNFKVDLEPEINELITAYNIGISNKNLLKNFFISTGFFIQNK